MTRPLRSRRRLLPLQPPPQSLHSSPAPRTAQRAGPTRSEVCGLRSGFSLFPPLPRPFPMVRSDLVVEKLLPVLPVPLFPACLGPPVCNLCDLGLIPFLPPAGNFCSSRRPGGPPSRVSDSEPLYSSAPSPPCPAMSVLPLKAISFPELHPTSLAASGVLNAHFLAPHFGIDLLKMFPIRYSPCPSACVSSHSSGPSSPRSNPI